MAAFAERLKLLESYGEVKISKNGNYYIEVYVGVPIVSSNIYSIRSVTKNGLHKIGDPYTYKREVKAVLMLTAGNKLKYKHFDKNNFSPLSLSVVRNYSVNPALKHMFLYGRKCEFLRNYDNVFLSYYNFLKSFSSFKEVWKFLGVSSKVEVTEDNLVKLMLGQCLGSMEEVLKTSYDLLEDTITMAKALKFDLKSSKKSVKNLHDDLVILTNNKEAEGFSDESVTPTWFSQAVTALEGLDVVFHTSKRQLFLAGQKMKNCISGRSSYLSNYVFFTIVVGGEEYIAQASVTIHEIKGRCNERCPEEIEKMLNDRLMSLGSETKSYTSILDLPMF